MSSARDIEAFDARAESYERGTLGRFHREIAERTVNLMLSSGPRPSRVLDVGCGTGYLLRVLAERCPEAIELAGVDPAPPMIRVAETSNSDERFWCGAGVGAENLPFQAGAFDVVVATTSFDHWSDQRAGLLECARVLDRAGRLVLADQFSLLLGPTLLLGRRHKARTKGRATRLLRCAGFSAITWHRLYTPLVNAVVATR